MTYFRDNGKCDGKKPKDIFSQGSKESTYIIVKPHWMEKPH